MNETTIKGGWLPGFGRIVGWQILLALLAVQLHLGGHPLLALGDGLFTLLFVLVLLGMIFGTSIEIGEKRLWFRSVFVIAYWFPWSDVRGFVVHDISPSRVFVVVLDRNDGKVFLNEVPMVKTSNPIALAARLNRAARERAAPRET
jgi:hypothetical protein